jgi:hypothetical protein
MVHTLHKSAKEKALLSNSDEVYHTRDFRETKIVDFYENQDASEVDMGQN